MEAPAASELATKFRKKWLRGVLGDLPFVNVNHYMHEGTEHGPQLLLRDGSLALFGSSRIEKIHQKVKMEIRRQLGSKEWSKTLLVRWMRRSDPGIRKNKPAGSLKDRNFNYTFCISITNKNRN